MQQEAAPELALLLGGHRHTNSPLGVGRGLGSGRTPWDKGRQNPCTHNWGSEPH